MPIPPEVKSIVSGPNLPGGFQMSLVWFLIIVAGASILLLPAILTAAGNAVTSGQGTLLLLLS